MLTPPIVTCIFMLTCYAAILMGLPVTSRCKNALEKERISDPEKAREAAQEEYYMREDDAEAPWMNYQIRRPIET